jgi:hypothetical protein
MQEEDEIKRIMVTPLDQGEVQNETTTPEADEEEDDEDQFHLLARGSRHFSLFPSLRKLQRKVAISMSHGYGGVRSSDYDHRGIDADLTVAQLFKQEFVTKPATNFHEEVKSAQKGLDGDFFLEMGLTKNISILPDRKGVQDVADGFQKMTQALGMGQRKSTSDEVLLSTPDTSSYISDDEDDESTPLTDFSGVQKKMPKKRKIPISAYLQLLLAVAALSSIGPFLDRLDGVSPPLRIVWRQQGTVLVLWPFALRSILVDGPPRLSLAQWCTFVCASFCYSVLTVAFSASLDYTTVNDATILTNSQSLLLVIAKLVIGSNVVFLEWSGKRIVLPALKDASLFYRHLESHVMLFPFFHLPCYYTRRRLGGLCRCLYVQSRFCRSNQLDLSRQAFLVFSFWGCTGHCISHWRTRIHHARQVAP